MSFSLRKTVLTALTVITTLGIGASTAWGQAAG